jgi:hypothetical protein
VVTGDVLHHFSEDPNIVRFDPHVPVTNPEHRAGVWVIDAAHAPLYWFPRDCPRVTVWPRTSQEVQRFDIELRAAPSLWPAHDLAIGDAWDFSIVRMRSARPRPGAQRPNPRR